MQAIQTNCCKKTDEGSKQVQVTAMIGSSLVAKNRWDLVCVFTQWWALKRVMISLGHLLKRCSSEKEDNDAREPQEVTTEIQHASKKLETRWPSRGWEQRPWNDLCELEPKLQKMQAKQISPILREKKKVGCGDEIWHDVHMCEGKSLRDGQMFGLTLAHTQAERAWTMQTNEARNENWF